MRQLVLLVLFGCATNAVDDVATDASAPRDATVDTSVKTDGGGGMDASVVDADAMSVDATTDEDVFDSGGCVTETKSPTTAMDVGTIGTRAWSNPTHALSANSQFAQISAMIQMEVSHYLQVGGFGFAVPNNLKIVGISVEIERKSLSAVGIVDHRVRIVKGGVIGATDKSVGGSWAKVPAKLVYGGMNELWGESWTPADVNAASFGVALAVKYNSNAGNDWSYVDHIQVSVLACP